MVLTVIGVVIGCDSDDGPKVTAPAQAPNGGGGGTPPETPDTPDTTMDPNRGGPTRSVESQTQGVACRRLTNDEIINTCSSTTLNVGFHCATGVQFTHHYRINPGGRMTRLPLMRQDCPGSSSLTSGFCAAPGVAQTTSSTAYSCYINTGIVPVVYAGTPGTPGPTPQPSSLYGSVAFGHLSSGYTWNFQYGSTTSEARSKSVADCRGDGSTDCQSLEFARGQCAALAHGTSTRPSFGAASRSTKLAAQNAAIAECRSARGTNCRIATGDSGHVASICLPSS